MIALDIGQKIGQIHDSKRSSASSLPGWNLLPNSCWAFDFSARCRRA
jgi:hypothetical protein